MKRHGLRDIYKGIRKPMAPPTRAERDRREELEREDTRREIDRYEGRKKKRGEEPGDSA
jgi:hypothetical protein